MVWGELLPSRVAGRTILNTASPLAAPAMPAMKDAAIIGSNTTGTRCDFTFFAPSIRTARRAASLPTDSGESSLSRKRL